MHRSPTRTMFLSVSGRLSKKSLFLSHTGPDGRADLHICSLQPYTSLYCKTMDMRVVYHITFVYSQSGCKCKMQWFKNLRPKT